METWQVTCLWRRGARRDQSAELCVRGERGERDQAGLVCACLHFTQVVISRVGIRVVRASLQVHCALRRDLFVKREA
jgi:hypothetical protein